MVYRRNCNRFTWCRVIRHRSDERLSTRNACRSNVCEYVWSTAQLSFNVCLRGNACCLLRIHPAFLRMAQSRMGCLFAAVEHRVCRHVCTYKQGISANGRLRRHRRITPTHHALYWLVMDDLARRLSVESFIRSIKWKVA